MRTKLLAGMCVLVLGTWALIAWSCLGSPSKSPPKDTRRPGVRIITPDLTTVCVVSREEMIREWIVRGGSPYEVPYGFYDRRDRTIWVAIQPSVAFFERVLGHEMLHAAGMNHDAENTWDLTPLQLQEGG